LKIFDLIFLMSSKKLRLFLEVFAITFCFVSTMLLMKRRGKY